jgi:hypothetical protein
MKSLWRDEDEVVTWYRRLDNVDKLSVNAWINRGDDRLLRSVARRIFTIRLSVIRAIELFSTDRLA